MVMPQEICMVNGYATGGMHGYATGDMHAHVQSPALFVHRISTATIKSDKGANEGKRGSENIERNSAGEGPQLYLEPPLRWPI